MESVFAVTLTNRESWALIHGIVLGGLFLIAFAGGFAGLYSLKSGLLTETGLVERMKRLKVGVTGMAVVAWLTVFSGTWIVYPWYRSATDPEAPRTLLKADPNLAGWHEFWFEWKEHIAWIAPLLATVAAFIVIYYNTDLIKNQMMRRIALGFFVAAFAVAAIAGLIGALVAKKAGV